MVTSLHLFVLTSFGLKLLALAKIMITETFNTQYTFSKIQTCVTNVFYFTLCSDYCTLHYEDKITFLFSVDGSENEKTQGVYKNKSILNF